MTNPNPYRVDRIALAARLQAAADAAGSQRALSARALKNETNLGILIRRLSRVPDTRVGLEQIEALAEASNTPLADLLGLAPPRAVAVSELPGWDAAEKAARRRRPLDPEHVWAAVRAVRMPEGARATPALAEALAIAWRAATDRD